MIGNKPIVVNIRSDGTAQPPNPHTYFEHDSIKQAEDEAARLCQLNGHWAGKFVVYVPVASFTPPPAVVKNPDRLGRESDRLRHSLLNPQ